MKSLYKAKEKKNELDSRTCSEGGDGDIGRMQIAQYSTVRYVRVLCV